MLDDLEDTFLITRKDKHLENLGRFVTTDLEAKIINMMALCYEILGDRNEGIKLLEKLKEGYERSKVTGRNHRIQIGLLYTNQCTYYEEMNRFDDAISLADKAKNTILNVTEEISWVFWLKKRHTPIIE